MKKKLLLIYPEVFSVSYADMKAVSFLTKKTGGILNVSLPTIAALTPPEFDVTIIDESVEPINFDAPYDLVGITGFPTQLLRAKKIALEFRKRGVPVVCGGSSVSVSPERWRDFSDVLMVGEAERTWPQFINDFLNGSYKDTYHETERFDLDISPVPDYTRLSENSSGQYIAGIVQTSRGCPFNCEFCDVVVYVGHKMRYKSIDTILQEVEQLYKMGIIAIVLADDNFSAGRENAKKILRALRDWNRTLARPVTFTTQLSIDIAQDDEFLELAVEAGLNRVGIGIETSNKESLKETGKVQNLKVDMIEEVKKFHQYGIIVISGGIVGFDHDDISIFQEQFDFFMKTGIPNIHLYPLQAPDGTPLKKRMVKEGRYRDWDVACKDGLEKANNFNTFTIIPKNMTIEQLQQGTYWLQWKLYNLANYAKRLETFFENFESSPKKYKVKIPKLGFAKRGYGIIYRIIIYYFTKAPADEKSALRRMIRAARRSSHPNSLTFAIMAFLSIKNTRGLILELNPEVDTVCLPE